MQRACCAVARVPVPSRARLRQQEDEYVKAEKKFNVTPVFTDAEVERTSVVRLTTRLDGYLATLQDDTKRSARLRDTRER